MCAGVTHAIMMHLFLFTQDACLALCSLQGHSVHLRVFFFHVQQPTTCPPVVGAPTAICGVPASEEGMEREWEGDDCHIVGPRSLCGLWFLVCNTVAMTSKRAEGRLFVRENAPRSVQEECGCSRSLILEQDGNLDATNTKVHQFQYVKSL